MIKYLSIYRPLNVLFVAIAQWLGAMFLDFGASEESIAQGHIYHLILGTAAILFFGYWLNDFLDKKRDAINKVAEKGITGMSDYLVYIHLLTFLAIAFYTLSFLDVKIRWVFLIAIGGLVLYNFLLKNLPLIGNMVVALLAALCIYCLRYQFVDVDLRLLIHFACLAGFITLVREVCKDAEDLEGDRETNAKTLPVVAGLKVTNALIYLFAISSLSFLMISLFYQQEFLTKPLLYVYYAYYLLFVFLPIFIVSITTRKAEKKEDFTTMSLYLKYAMFAGILSMLFF